MCRWSGSLETSSRTAPAEQLGWDSAQEQPRATASRPAEHGMERYNFYIYININFICDHMKELQTF